MGGFRTGADAAKEAAKSQGSFAKTHYLSLDDGETAILRFLTDYTDWIVVDQHQNVPTKGKPKDWPDGANWPQKMGAVCRKDVAFDYPDCYICDHVVGKVTDVKRPSARTWAYAVLREAVMEDGQIVGYRDQTREIVKTDKDGKPTGEVETEKAIVVVNLGYKNFFAALEGFGKHYQTVLDRDYLVKRSGKSTDTTYNIIPMDPIQVDDQGTIFDVRLPQFAERYKPTMTLAEVVTDRSTDEFYARFFDTRVEAPPTRQAGEGKDSPASGGSEEAAETKPSGNDLDAGALAAMAARVKGATAPAAASSEEAPAAAPAAAKKSGMRDFG